MAWNGKIIKGTGHAVCKLCHCPIRKGQLAILLTNTWPIMGSHQVHRSPNCCTMTMRANKERIDALVEKAKVEIEVIG